MEKKKTPYITIKFPKRGFLLIILLLMLGGVFTFLQTHKNISAFATTPSISPPQSPYVNPIFQCLSVGNSCDCPKTTNLECSNDRDDDNDGTSDYGFDYACSSCEDNSESDVFSQCQDRKDNDGDNKKDFPADPGCTSQQDNTEKDSMADKCRNQNDCDRADQICDTDGVCKNAVLCGSPAKYCNPGEACINDTCQPKPPDASSCKGLEISTQLELDKTYVVPGETIIGTITYKNPCAVDFSVNTIKIVARDGASSIVDFSPESSEVTVKAGKEFPLEAKLTIRGDEPPGLWKAFAMYRDLRPDGEPGNWSEYSNLVPFTVVAPSRLGEACGSTQPCSFGLLCTNSVCVQPAGPQCDPLQCADGLDNDNDGQIDYPADTDCANLEDDDENNTAAPPVGNDPGVPPANPPAADPAAPIRCSANSECTVSGQQCHHRGYCLAGDPNPSGTRNGGLESFIDREEYLRLYRATADNDGQLGITINDLRIAEANSSRYPQRIPFARWLIQNFEAVDGNGRDGSKNNIVSLAELWSFIGRNPVPTKGPGDNDGNEGNEDILFCDLNGCHL